MKTPGSTDDPLWYKDAIIYELHVRTFFDANNDGIGDFRGLVQKLDYLSELGVTCLWLLPFFPSPLRDDGYDIADYYAVHSAYGTLDDFREFLDAAHARGMQVLIELVVNHTSDQHPLFQAARHAPPGSPERDFYVWSDTDHRYPDVRIIFTDTEKSNWTWDPEAKAYYWHRFFSHQPDLNFDNPAVVDEIVRIMRFWLDLGVDALRLDAIPYLVEREGTNCENLPETHAVIKGLRRALDEQHANRMILAEANQWPSDVRAYFGDDDECHMAFHFPLMPRLFMALRLEDRHPVVDIMRQTPNIPASCQWGLFLRNHDELTLEMVTDDERDYMYLAYSADPRMRVNVGIRRRLAPLLENNRRRIELLNCILLSFPGTPIIYYGDEIGMGDNIYLGDRHGVRTPMQWSADRNAGFSRANPAKLNSPVIMDPVFGYEVVNVESQQSDPSSLFNWAKHMLALRKLFKVFGRGTIEFFDPANRKILAYIRRYERERVLCVANLSRFAQPVELDLSAFAGMTPVEMLGYVEFPRIGRTPYPLTLAPYGFLWFELYGEPEPERDVTVAAPAAEVALALEDGWDSLFAPGGRQILESRYLPEFLVRQRWFDGATRIIRRCVVEDWVSLSPALGIALVGVEFAPDGRATYVVPLAATAGPVADRLRADQPAAIVCPVTTRAGLAVVHDALALDDHCRALFALMARGDTHRGASGTITGITGAALREAGPDDEMSVTRVTAASPPEQRNASVLIGDRFIMRILRRLEYGPDPDAEMTRYLSETRQFDGVPAFAGLVEYRRPGSGRAGVAVAQRLVPNQGEGWTWMLDELDRYYERVQTLPADELLPFAEGATLVELAQQTFPPGLDEALGLSDDAAASLGARTAEMHQALGQRSTDAALDPQPFTLADLQALSARWREHATRVFDTVAQRLPTLPAEAAEGVQRLIALRPRLLERLQLPADEDPGCTKIRVHGDYHLGHVLRVGSSFVAIDFEGGPERSLAERRLRRTPLEDVASMMRSFSYAAHSALFTHVARGRGVEERLRPWARLWERAVNAAFLRGYRNTAGNATFLPRDAALFERLLEGQLIHKALAELQHELEHRVDWVRVPLEGIFELEGAIHDGASSQDVRQT